jgi:hypothetical protein
MSEDAPQDQTLPPVEGQPVDQQSGHIDVSYHDGEQPAENIDVNPTTQESAVGAISLTPEDGSNPSVEEPAHIATIDHVTNDSVIDAPEVSRAWDMAHASKQMRGAAATVRKHPDWDQGKSREYDYMASKMALIP